MNQSDLTKANKKAERKNAHFFKLYCEAEGLPAPELEFAFCQFRNWRADFAWPEHRLILEVQGGHWTKGHGMGSNARGDMERQAYATLAGWRMLYVMPEQLITKRTINLVKHALGVEELDLKRLFGLPEKQSKLKLK